MKNHVLFLIFVLLISSINLSACMDQLQQTAKIIDVKFSFQPDSITVPIGTTVTWINHDSANHTIISDGGKFESETIKSGDEFRFTFMRPGTYGYHCSIHHPMIGEVVVTPAQANPTKINETGATQPIIIKTNTEFVPKVDDGKSECVPVSKELFFSRNDPADPRLGDTVQRLDGESLLAAALADSDVTIVGVPDDRGIAANHGRPGAAKAPTFIRRSFYQMVAGRFTGNPRIVDVGDIKLCDTVEETHKRLTRVVRDIISAGPILICIGGGHDIAHPGVAGFIEGYSARNKLGDDAKFGVVNVDAHFDVRDMSHGITSGTPHYRTLEMPKTPVRGKNFVEFGIQERCSSVAHEDYLKEKNAKIFFLDDVQRNVERSFKKALGIAACDTKAVYVSFDIDSVRKSDAPGASASYPNGLSATDAERIAYLAGRDPRVGMLDIVEVSPDLDRDNLTSQLAAGMMFYFIKGVSERDNKKGWAYDGEGLAKSDEMSFLIESQKVDQGRAG